MAVGAPELALESRRFELLGHVVETADPLVWDSVGLLSAYADELYFIGELDRDCKLTAAAARAVPEPMPTFAAHVNEAMAQRQVYLAALAVTPGDVWKAVAEAHRT